MDSPLVFTVGVSVGVAVDTGGTVGSAVGRGAVDASLGRVGAAVAHTNSEADGVPGQTSVFLTSRVLMQDPLLGHHRHRSLATQPTQFVVNSGQGSSNWVGDRVGKLVGDSVSNVGAGVVGEFVGPGVGDSVMGIISTAASKPLATISCSKLPSSTDASMEFLYE